MGFFSSRKVEDNNLTSIPSTADARDRSVIHSIRSRFYGKNKSKQREEQQPLPSFSVLDAPTAQTLSNAKIPTHVPAASSPLARNPSNSSGPAGPSALRGHRDRSNSTTPPRITHLADRATPSPSPTPQSRNGSPPTSKMPAPSTPLPRKATDTVTVTLAQRLNELALANSEGLLNDDEYRLLRQNLFERFASSTIVPCETPVVPAARSRHRVNGQGAPPTRPLSNFQVEVQRSPSIVSKTSMASGVTSFLRRATSRRTPVESRDQNETSSMMSSSSKVQSMFKLRGFSKQSSGSSVHTTMSRTQADNMSMSSRQTGVGSDRAHSDFSSSISRSAAASIRRLAAPPSSFPARVILSDNKYTTNVDIFDEEHLKTAKEIQEEILTVEAEGKRLMNAFNGLELTTLARVQRRQGRPLPTTGNVESAWTLLPDGRSQRRMGTGESDSGSVRSATSAGTGPSVNRSAYSGRKAARVKGLRNPPHALGVSSKSGSLHRKDSSSSVGSQERRTGKPLPVPPALSGSANYGYLGVANSSNVSLARSIGQTTMHAMTEDQRSIYSMATRLRDEDGQLEGEMEEIRRRREDVSLRYEARLEYLRAKLKGAQLHEKLLKK